MRKRAVLFDLDGVLIDSETAYTRFWDEIDHIYPSGVENYAIAIKGTTLPEIMKVYEDEAVRDDILRRIDEFQASMVYEIFPGVETFLSDLTANGIPAAIVTSSDDRKMSMLFSQHPGLRDYFGAIIDASQVTRSKPDPQGYLLAAKAIGADSSDCFVFEDSLQGLRAGRAAGATVIGLTTTYPYEKVRPLADAIIDTLDGFTVEDMLKVVRAAAD